MDKICLISPVRASLCSLMNLRRALSLARDPLSSRHQLICPPRPQLQLMHPYCSPTHSLIETEDSDISSPLSPFHVHSERALKVLFQTSNKATRRNKSHCADIQKNSRERLHSPVTKGKGCAEALL